MNRRHDLIDALGSISAMEGAGAVSRLADLLPHLQGAAHRLQQLAVRESFDERLAFEVVADGFRAVALGEEVAALAASLAAELARLPLFADAREVVESPRLAS